MFHTDFSQDKTIDVLTGRSSTSFEVFNVIPEEVKTIILKSSSSEGMNLFGLVTTRLSDNVKAHLYRLEKTEAETMIEIEGSQSEFRVSLIVDGSKKEILKSWKSKFYRESKKNTDKNWWSFMQRRGTFRQEGPLFFSDTSFSGGDSIREFGAELRSMIEKNIIR